MDKLTRGEDPLLSFLPSIASAEPKKGKNGTVEQPSDGGGEGVDGVEKRETEVTSAGAEDVLEEEEGEEEVEEEEEAGLDVRNMLMGKSRSVFQYQLRDKYQLIPSPSSSSPDKKAVRPTTADCSAAVDPADVRLYAEWSGLGSTAKHVHVRSLDESNANRAVTPQALALAQLTISALQLVSGAASSSGALSDAASLVRVPDRLANMAHGLSAVLKVFLADTYKMQDEVSENLMMLYIFLSILCSQM
jgi:hypothetical protein